MCLEIAQKGLAFYLSKVPVYATIYGAFAALPIFLVWIYVSWLILLLGAVVVAYTPSLLSQVKRWPDTPGHRFALALAILKALWQVQNTQERGLSNEALAQHLRTAPAHIDPLLYALRVLYGVVFLNAVDDVHGQKLLAQAMVVARPAAKVQLADRHGFVAGIPQHMVPARHGAIVGIGVVPETHLVHVATGGKPGTRRHTDRAGRIGLGEARAVCGQGVEVGCLYEGMPGTTQEMRVVFVGHQDQHIERVGHCGRLESKERPLLGGPNKPTMGQPRCSTETLGAKGVIPACAPVPVPPAPCAAGPHADPHRPPQHCRRGVRSV